MSSSKETTAKTLSLLEERLRRVSFVLNGNNSQSDADNGTTSEAKSSAIARLRALERTLQALVAKSSTASDVIALQKRHPNLFHTTSSSEAASTLPPTSLASLVLAHSQLYHSLSTKLSQLESTSVPDPATAVKLIELRPRIDHVQAKQQAQAQEFAELRLRSARALESWYEDGVIGMAERWAGWEERLRSAEIIVRRREAARRRDEGAV